MSLSDDDDSTPQDDEVEIGDQVDDSCVWAPDSQLDSVDHAYTAFAAGINTYSAYIYDSPAELVNYRVLVDLKRSFLPLSMQAAFGFTVHQNLLHIELELDAFSWSRRPKHLNIAHPVLGNAFVGRPFVMSVVDTFFTPFYQPKSEYRSARFYLTPTGTADPVKLRQVVSQGFSEASASKALVLSLNNVDKAIDFLRTGELPGAEKSLTIDYTTCPLLFLMLELAEAFLDLSDHCCICRDKLPPGVKPSVCAKPLCNFQLSQIGVGNNVYQEIRRDQMAADLVLSIFSAALETDYLTPAPPDITQQEALAIVQILPSMADLLKKTRDDREIAKLIQPQGLALLRWVLLSNRSHLIFLPDEMALPEFKGSKQFMTLLSSPEAENVFNRLKEKNGSFHLWHGSHGQRWHSIVRNGLKNATGTQLQANGAALGEGIYFARDSSTSWGYSRESPNNYKASALGTRLHIISLCEVIKLRTGALKDHGWAHTLTNEDAVIVRFLMVGGGFARDVVANPLQRVPTLRDVLEFQASFCQEVSQRGEAQHRVPLNKSS
jgi:poly [ADP-ribose] polymerase 6/8